MKHVLSLRNAISLILAITVLASVAILPVSASSVVQATSTGTTEISSINMQTGKAQYNFPCTINLNGNWKKVKESKGFTTDQQLLDDININGIKEHGDDGAVDLSANINDKGPRTYGICENKNIFTAIGGTVLKNPTVSDETGPTYFGWYVQANNDYAQKTYYGHMESRSALAVNTYYPAGTYIGTMGCTGNTIGCGSGIVHFDAWVGGSRTANWEFILTPKERIPFSSVGGSNTYARQFFDRGNGSLNNERLNLEVCADNLAGNTLYVKSWRNSGFLPDQSAQAVGNCYTFWDLDGGGEAFTDVPYKVWVSMGNWPDTNWSSPCLEATSGLGMCTQAQYPSESFDPLLDPSPEVISIVRNDGSPTEAPNVNYFVTFSESVFDVDVNDFVLTKTGTISGESITSVNLTTEMQTSYMVTVNTGTGDGELRLDVPSGATITDLGGKPLIKLPFNSGESYTISKLPPSVVSSVRANSNLTNAANVGYTVTFSESVTGVDTGDFTLTKTGTISGVSVKDVSGGPSIYTVNVNTGMGDGDLRLDLVSATITDLAGKSLSDLPYTKGENYTIDKSAPAVLSSVRVNPNPTNLPNVDFTVTFSESVTGVDITDFAIAKTGTISGESVTNVSGGPRVYTVNVNTGTGDGGLGLYLHMNATVTDLAGSLLTGLPYADGDSYLIDRIPPSVVVNLANPNPTNLSSVEFTVTFSEPVTGVENSDFVITKTGTISGESVTNISDGPTNYTVTVNTGMGDGDLCLGVSTAVTDLAGNPISSIPNCYTIDKISPVVLSFVRVNPSPNNLLSVDFNVTFSESVTGVDVTDFAIDKTGTISGESVTGISGGPSIYTVSVNTGTGDGDLRLDMLVSATVNDSAGNTLAGLTYTGGESYAIDRSAPMVDSIVPENENFIVTFHEPVTGVDISDFVLIKTGTISGESITDVVGGPNIYTVSINTGTGSGDLCLGRYSNATISDLAGNGQVGAFPCDSITFDKLALRSTGSGDGWMLESNENGNEGGSKNSNDDTFRLGDDTQNRQYRSILYFPTNYLPNNAVITKGILMIKKQSVVGADPFTTHGNISLDVRKGPFGKFDISHLSSINFWALLAGDFEAPADLYSAGLIENNPVNDWYWITLDSNALAYINRFGVTQIRLAFQLDDDNDLGNDFIKFYSGDAEQQKDRPHLQIQYYVP